ncbi:MAG: DNA-nicking Smr family endonuclease [Sphingobacteriales bacterium]|jgi:DNA-nicking Smr family endonuclease
MKFKLGDRVAFLNEVGEGVITRLVDAEMVELEDTDGFPRIVLGSELILAPDQEKMREAYALGGNRKLEPHEKAALRKLEELDGPEPRRSQPHRDSNKKRVVDMEVDLHIHEITESNSHMTPGEMVSFQMKHFERMLEIALKGRLKRLVVIHGVGEGVLRAEIRLLLSDVYPQIEFFDAPYTEYGHGATELILRQG